MHLAHGSVDAPARTRPPSGSLTEHGRPDYAPDTHAGRELTPALSRLALRARAQGVANRKGALYA